MPLVSYATLTLDSTSLTSDGALTVKSASSSATIIGHADQSGAITIASTTQALTLDIGKSSAVLTLSLASGTGGHTVNIATGTSTAKTVNIATGGSILNIINFGSASSTVNLPGSLGVGITSPSTTLHLSGTFRFVDGNQGAGKSLYSDASGGATWQTPSSTLKTLTKVTSTVTVSNTTNETNLLSYTVPGNTLGTSKQIRIYVIGDLLNNSGGALNAPRFKLKLGATTLLDTGAGSGSSNDWNTGTARYGFEIFASIANLDATNSQMSHLRVQHPRGSGNVGGAFTTGNGAYQSTGGGVVLGVGSNATTVDTTADQSLVLSVILPTASTSVDLKLLHAIIELIE